MNPYLFAPPASMVVLGVNPRFNHQEKKAMTAMNWERLQRSRRTSDYCGDDLPPIGSWEDRRRYAEQPIANRNRRRGPGPVDTWSRRPAFETLQKYVEHASHRDFARKPPAIRKEMANILEKLHGRCTWWQTPLLTDEIRLLQRAIQLIKDLRTNSHGERT